MSVSVALPVYESWKDSWENGTAVEDSVDFARFLISKTDKEKLWVLMHVRTLSALKKKIIEGKMVTGGENIRKHHRNHRKSLCGMF